MTIEQSDSERLSYLSPDDAALLNMMRVFVAEASRVYETRLPATPSEALYVDSPSVVYQLLAPEMAHLSQEQLRTVNVNTRHRMLGTHLIYQGTLRSTSVRLAEIFRPAIVERASGLVVVHNHPSGDPSPSPDDLRVTEQLVRAGQLLDIEVLDHVVVVPSGYVSLKERGLGIYGLSLSDRR